MVMVNSVDAQYYWDLADFYVKSLGLNTSSKFDLCFASSLMQCQNYSRSYE